MNESVGPRGCSKTPFQTRLQALNAFNTLSRAILCLETNSFWNSSKEPGDRPSCTRSYGLPVDHGAVEGRRRGEIPASVGRNACGVEQLPEK